MARQVSFDPDLTTPDPGGAASRGRGRLAFAVAAVLYLGAAWLVFAPALRAPDRLLPYTLLLDEPTFQRTAQLDHYDALMVTSVVARNAATIVSRPWDLAGDGQCYPMPRGYTLGEHMFGLGLLAAVPWAISGDPLVSYNVALVLTLWVAGLTMYRLSWHFTGSASAAFVAGLLFELAPRRIADPSHPYIHGDLWTPLALLFFHRLLVRGRWRDGLGLTVCMTLAMLESLYPLLGFALLLAIYAPYAIVRHRANVAAFLPKLVVCGVWLLLVAWLVFGPYFATRDTWGLLGGRRVNLYSLGHYLPGRATFPGYALLVLVVIGIADRLRGARLVSGEDPRLAYLTGGVLLLAVTIGFWWLPLVGTFPSPLMLARAVLPGLDAVRALPAVGIAAGLPLAFVAGYGVLALTERLPRAARGALTVVIATLVVANVLHPALARPSFGGASLGTGAFVARPPDEDVALYRASAEGAVLDLPYVWTGLRRLTVAEDLLRTSYSPRPTAGCYNSFLSPVQTQVGDLADALPDPGAAEALHALGFATVVVETKQLLPDQRRAFRDALLGQAPDQRRLAPLGSTPRLATYRLSARAPVRRDFRALQPEPGGAAAAIAAPVPAGESTLSFAVHNARNDTYRHPEPLAPSDLVLRWSDVSGRVVEQHVRALLPLAIGPQGTGKVRVTLVPPVAPGAYVVTGARAAEPERPLFVRALTVAEPPPPGTPPVAPPRDPAALDAPE